MLIVTGVPVGRTSAVVLPRKLGIEDPEGKAATSKTLLFPTGISTVIRPVARSMSRTMGVISGPVIVNTRLPMLDGMTWAYAMLIDPKRVITPSRRAKRCGSL